MPVYENTGNYLLVKIYEPYSLKLILITTNEIAARCRQDRLDLALADLRQFEGNPTIMDGSEMGAEVARVLGSRIHGRGGRTQHDQLAGRNRGGQSRRAL